MAALLGGIHVAFGGLHSATRGLLRKLWDSESSVRIVASHTVMQPFSLVGRVWRKGLTESFSRHLPPVRPLKVLGIQPKRARPISPHYFSR